MDTIAISTLEIKDVEALQEGTMVQFTTAMTCLKCGATLVARDAMGVIDKRYVGCIIVKITDKLPKCDGCGSIIPAFIHYFHGMNVTEDFKSIQKPSKQ